MTNDQKQRNDSIMKKIQLIIVLFILLALPLVIAAHEGTADAPQSGVVLSLPGGLCNRLYLPVMGDGMNAGGAANSVAQLADLVLPPGPDNRNPDCAGFPDFNGDGYADLVIGAPRKGNFDTGIVQVIYGSATGANAGTGAVINDQVWHRQLGSVAAEANDWYGAAVAMGDFNNDGYDDLAIGIPGATINGLVGAGAVQIFYGSPHGLTNSGVQNLSRASAGIPGTPELNANFGASLAVGDFDGDGYADLAIGIPRATVDGVAYAGAVQILYGRNGGLGVIGNELISQNSNGAISAAEFNDQFGFALAAADFNNDGADDLAVGVPYEDVGGHGDAGAVQVFYGKTGNLPVGSGLIVSGVVNVQFWSPIEATVEGDAAANDHFGWSLAVGDFDGNGYADLAVGIPQRTHGAGAGAIAFGGAVNVIMGGTDGLAATVADPARLWHQNRAGMLGEVGVLDLFGYALAAADFNNDGYADLAIGVPGDDYILGIVDTGSVQIVYGSTDGLTTAGNARRVHATAPTAGDSFGAALFAGDFNGDGNADLAVGAPEDMTTAVNGGSVTTLYGHQTHGLLQTEAQLWYPGFNGLTGSVTADDYFGEALPGSPKR
jgi:hypothetical protein